MKVHPGLLIGMLVLLLVMPAPAGAGDIPKPAAAAPDPAVHAASLVPAITTPTLQPAVRYPVKVVTVVVTTTATQTPAGTLAAGSVPSGASVYIDGTLKGTTPLTLRSVPAGVHEVTFAMPGYTDYTTKVTVTAGVVAKVVGTLTPVTPGTTTAPNAPQTTLVPVRRTALPPLTTVPVAALHSLQPVTPQPTGTCTRHYLGSGVLGREPDGRLNCTVIIRSGDRVSAISLQEGTLVTGAGKSIITDLQIAPVNPSDMPPLPGSSSWTGHAFRFLPDHAAFDPPVLVSFTLAQDEWDRSDPAGLMIMETRETGPGWEPLSVSVDPVTRTISAPVSHFSIIALFSAGPAAETPVSRPSPVVVKGTAAVPGPASLPLSPLVPDTYAPLAAVGAGVALSLAGAVAGGSTVFSSFWSRVTDLIQEFLGSEVTGFMNTAEVEKRGIQVSENRSAGLIGISPREMLVIGISAAGFAAALMLQDRLDPELTTVIVFVGAGGIATILPDLAQKDRAFASGCVTEYQFWGLGTVTVFVTA
ncbi:MAG TPA: PEGA domain-containing protein, partial [Methanoregula sp.]|nr:PEGA domain-containing protein [Methanoregula sp.]